MSIVTCRQLKHRGIKAPSRIPARVRACERARLAGRFQQGRRVDPSSGVRKQTGNNTSVCAAGEVLSPAPGARRIAAVVCFLQHGSWGDCGCGLWNGRRRQARPAFLVRHANVGDDVCVKGCCFGVAGLPYTDLGCAFLAIKMQVNCN